METHLWKEMLDPYEQAVTELVVKFQNTRREFVKKNQYSPIESVNGRVKSVASILEKMQRKGVSFENLESEIEDIAGVRIICQFGEDIERVAALIGQRTDMKIMSRKDYLTNQKKSGYRSYHLIIQYCVQTVTGPKVISAEIQIRTMAMNFWATTEHSLQYKYKGEIPEHLQMQLLRISDAIEIMDREMSQIRSEIMDAQTASQIEINLVKEILRNIENLYRQDNKREAIKIQTEFYRVFASHNLEELTRFSKFVDIMAEGSRAQSVEPIGFH